MKKAYILLMLALALVLSGCGKSGGTAPAESSGPVPEQKGDAELTGYYSADDGYGGQDWVVFWEEGDGYLFFGDGIYVKNWKDGAIELDESDYAYDYKLENGTLTLYGEVDEMVFQADTAENFENWYDEVWLPYDEFFEGYDDYMAVAENLAGAWNLIGGETEGWEWSAEEEGIHADIDIGFDEYTGMPVANYWYINDYSEMFCGDMAMELYHEDTWLGNENGWYAEFTGYGEETTAEGAYDVLTCLDVSIDPETDILWCAPLVSYDNGENYEGIATFYFVRGEAVG